MGPSLSAYLPELLRLVSRCLWTIFCVNSHEGCHKKATYILNVLKKGCCTFFRDEMIFFLPLRYTEYNLLVFLTNLEIEILNSTKTKPLIHCVPVPRASMVILCVLLSLTNVTGFDLCKYVWLLFLLFFLNKLFS